MIHLLAEAAFALVMILCVWVLVRLIRRQDFEEGRKAFRAGLRYNPGWSESVKAGWLAEKIGE